MKKIFKLLAGFMSVGIFASFASVAPISAQVSEEEYKTMVVISENTTENKYYLSNGCAISQNEFTEYSGETFSLEYGDVIKVKYDSINELEIGQFSWGKDGDIRYMGKAKDYYDDVKDLTVIENKNNCELTFADSEGNTYVWGTYGNPAFSYMWGYTNSPEFDLSNMEVGDVYCCAVAEKTNNIGRVIIPVEAKKSAVNTEESDNRIVTVTAVNEGGNEWYLSNGCVISENQLKQYGYEKASLDYGDVLMVDYAGIEPISPGRFVMNENSTVKYLGKAKDIYKTKVFTVSENDGVNIRFQDADGKEYLWGSNPSFLKEYGYTILNNELDAENLKVNDAVECAVNVGICYNDDETTYEEEYVVIPVGKADESVCYGDVNGDENIDIFDAVLVAKYSVNTEILDDEAMIRADFNKDGVVDIFDASLIAKKTVE